MSYDCPNPQLGLAGAQVLVLGVAGNSALQELSLPRNHLGR